ncbi:TIGR01777 family oxidoreductase [Polaribacter sp. MED152]|uniref:TIGR01777 family oxidoreductase n=1 Tax=Polaribacter sp. MED152 TaxID=313598 RepID=UPI0000689ADF|nr:TIGR01777 family oxidoreductase [Polaribacter sp. MED152]EAQ40951.1 NAD dependent epimerase/dehydratase family protein [Polaribacter sp. MED152]
MAKILISGGTGLVGTQLTKLLLEKEHSVNILTRTPDASNEFKWDISKQTIDVDAFKDVEYIIHLAGAGIADERWSDKRKKVIIDSRVDSANLLFSKVKALNLPLKGFISASGSGYYGAITSDKIFEENDAAGNDFLGEVCEKWEAAALQFESINIPVSILRTGIVLSRTGGALEKMKTPVIAALGSGKQYMPWIHLDDLCQMYIHQIEENVNGVFNAVAPEHHTSTTFSKQLAKSVSRPYVGINVPSFMLKLAFGDMAKILLEGSRLASDKIRKHKFTFQFPELAEALNNLFKK